MDAKRFCDVLDKVTKDYTRQRKQEMKDGQAVLRRRERLTFHFKTTIKEAAFAIMKTAYLKASDGGTLPAHARQIMYAARGYIQTQTGETLKDTYFTQDLLPTYLQEHSPETRDWDVVFDARGHLVEPHVSRKVALGTLPVREYLRDRDYHRETGIGSGTYPTIGPKNRYQAVLFIEKEGFMPLFEKVKLAERFDIAIMSTKGVSTIAARELVDDICGRRKVPLLILRDFDKAGFTIAGTLQRATWRYAFQYPVNAVDLGLRLADVERYGLDPEEVSYGESDPCPNLRENGANDKEIKFLCSDEIKWRVHPDTGKRVRRYTGQRVELNAFTSGQLVSWIESKLAEQEATNTKLVPPEDVLGDCYRREYERQFLARELAKIRAANAERFAGLTIPDTLNDLILTEFEQDEALAWDEAVAAIVETRGREYVDGGNFTSREAAAESLNQAFDDPRND